MSAFARWMARSRSAASAGVSGGSSSTMSSMLHMSQRRGNLKAYKVPLPVPVCAPAEPLPKTRGKTSQAVHSAVTFDSKSGPRQTARTDALLGAAIKTVEELEALVSMLGAFGSDEDKPRRVSLASELREIAGLFDRLPLLENDLRVIKKGLRALLSTDPDKTPRAISIKDLQAVTVTEETRFEPVEDERRTQTKPGLGIPLPKNRDR